jgi:hypothetical protein
VVTDVGAVTSEMRLNGWNGLRLGPSVKAAKGQKEVGFRWGPIRRGHSGPAASGKLGRTVIMLHGTGPMIP